MSRTTHIRKAVLCANKVVAGRYLVERELGCGGVGGVFLVKDLHRDGDRFALKILSEALKSEQIAEQFVNEFRLLKRLDRPELVKVFDYGVSEDYGAYYTMEFVKWNSLQQLESTLQRDDIIRVLDELAKSISILHSSQIAHYDLKPDNVFLNSESLSNSSTEHNQSLIKIGDLGMAGAVGKDARSSRFGSFYYSAPEMFGDNEIDLRADIYSFGMIALYLVLGPIEFRERMEVLRHKHKLQWLPDAQDFRNINLPETLVNSLCLCLNPEPGFRPTNINDLIDVLEKSLGEDSKERSSQLNLNFIGRTDTLRFLGSIYHNVKQGEQWIFQLIGEAGIGKSKIIEEFVVKKQVEGVDVVRLEGDNIQPLLGFLKYQIQNRDNFQDDVDYFGDFSEQLVQLLQERQTSKPLIISWFQFDGVSIDTQRLLKQLCLEQKENELLWILESRNDQPAFTDLSYNDKYVRRYIKPLSLDEVSEFIAQALGKPIGWESLGAQIYALSMGKPSLVIYSLNKLIETRQIVYSKQSWYIIVDDLELKNNGIDDLIVGSLKDIPKSAKWALEWLSVYGSAFSVSNLKSVLEISNEEWIRDFQILNKKGFLEAVNGIVRFKTPILREVIYRHISSESRRRLHLLVGRWLEENLKVANDFPQLQNIAHHYYIASEDSSFLRVIRKLLDISGNAKNLVLIPDLFETALKNFRDNLKETHQYRCVELLASHNLRIKNFEVAAGLFKHLIDARAFKNLEYPGFLELRLGLCYSYMSEYAKAEEILDLAFSNLIKFDPSAAGDALALLVRLYYQQSDIDRSNRLLDKYLELVERLDEPEHKLAHRLKCSVLLKNMRRLEEASELLLRIRSEYRNPWKTKLVFTSYKTELRLAFYQNDWKRIVEIVNQMEKTSSTTDINHPDKWQIEYSRISAQLLRGQIVRGIDGLDKLMTKVRLQVEPLQQASMMLNLIKFYYNCGFYWKGMSYIRKGLKLSRHAKSLSLQAIYIAWAARFYSMMGKSYSRLIEYSKRLKDLANRPNSNFLVPVLLAEHGWMTDNSQLIKENLNHVSSVNATSQVDYPECMLAILNAIANPEFTNANDKKYIENFDSKQDEIVNVLTKAQYNHLLMSLILRTRKLNTARRYLKTALKLYSKTNSIFMLAKCQEDYGRVAEECGDLDEAEYYLGQAAKLYSGLGLPYQFQSVETRKLITNDQEVEADNMYGHKLKDLADILELLNGMEDPDKITGKLLEMAIQAVDASRGMIFFRNPRSKKLANRASIRIGTKEGVDISTTIVDQVYTSGEAIYHNNALLDNYLSTLASVQLNKIRAIACLPIISKGDIEGVLYLDNLGSGKKYEETDISYLNLLAHVIGLILTHTRLVHLLTDDLSSMRAKLDHLEGYDEFKGRSKPIKKIFEMLHYIKQSDTPVLVLGESGTGKELISRIICRQSSRATKPFYALNCAAMPDQLLDSMLFGHCKGAFTDAKSDHAGFFEQAADGTIFLDEVDEMNLAMQGKLLRVLQEGEFYRLGETRMRKTDVRVIAAGKDNLPKLVEDGRFRQDLYFRLYVVKLRLPPLRDRVDDIPLLINHFLNKYCEAEDINVSISPSAEVALTQYKWPGNVRELENTIRSAIIFSKGRGRIELAHLPQEIIDNRSKDREDMLTLREQLDSVEKRHILNALGVSDWNITETANLLNIHRSTLTKKMNKYNIYKP